MKNSENKIPYNYWIPILIVGIILATLFFLGLNITSNIRKDADRLKAVNHLKSIKFILITFENDHRMLPGQQVVDKALFPGAEAETSNDCFRQTIQGTPDVQSESIFYVPSKLSSIPDDLIGDASNHFSHACAKGEVGFLYVDAPFATDKAPLVAAPLLNTRGKFDHNIYGGQATVLLKDGSVQTYPINEDTGKIIFDINKNGKPIDIFSPSNPAFTKPPAIKYPEPK